MEPNSNVNQPQPTMPPLPAPITPPTPQIPSTTPAAPVIPSPKPKKNIFVLIIGGIIILGMLIAISVGFILWKFPPKQISSYEECIKIKGIAIQPMYPGVCIANGLSFRESTSPITQSSESETSPFSDLANNWKAYINSTFGFSLQYPSAWKITTDLKLETARFALEQPVVLIHDSQLLPNPDGGPNSIYPSHYIEISTFPSSKTLQEFLNDTVASFSSEVQKDIREFMEQKTLTINQIPAVSFIEPGMGGRGKMIAVSNGKHIIIFSFPYQTDYTKDKDFTQILSTFKFLN